MVSEVDRDCSHAPSRIACSSIGAAQSIIAFVNAFCMGLVAIILVALKPFDSQQVAAAENE